MSTPWPQPITPWDRRRRSRRPTRTSSSSTVGLQRWSVLVSPPHTAFVVVVSLRVVTVSPPIERGVAVFGTPLIRRPCSRSTLQLACFPPRVHPSVGERARRSTAFPMTAPPPAWGWVDTPSTILLNSPFARGGVRLKRGSCPAAGAGGQPPHRYIIHRMRKPSRSGTHSRRPGVAQREEGPPLHPSRPGSLLQRTALRSALCRPPARPCPLFNPAWWFRPPPTLQRRNYNPTPPPCFPSKTPPEVNSRKLYSSLYRGRLGR